MHHFDFLKGPFGAEAGADGFGEGLLGGPARREDLGAPRGMRFGVRAFPITEQPEERGILETPRDIRYFDYVRSYAQNH
jgi:hypothetical protein